MDNTRTHPLQRVKHALHGPTAQRFVAVKCCCHRRSGHRADRKPHSGAGISEIQHASRLREPPDPDPVYAPGLISGPLHARTECTHDIGGVQDILTLQQPCNGAFADGQGAKNERPVRNRLVAGYPDPSLDRAALAGCQRHWFGRVHRGGILGNLRPPTTQPRAASSCRF
jgi:hypothetical protein